MSARKGRTRGRSISRMAGMGEGGKISAAATAIGHDEMANAIRALAMDAVEKAKSGHPGMPMGMAEVATVLFREQLRFDAADPEWPDRDRFVLSAGHGSMLLYALLYLTGYPGVTLEELENFRQLGSKTAGHPEYGYAPGIETTTGPLGQGLGNAVGMALAERLLNARLGRELVDHHTWVIAGDGCLMEGISHEAISLAGHLKLGKLIVLFDDNAISIDGPTDLAVSDDQIARFKASGWNTARVDGHDPKAISAALAQARADDSAPWLIACRTVIGYGAPSKAGKASTHGEPLGAAEITGAREKLGWPHEAFVVPEPILTAWRAVGVRHAGESAAWRARLAEADAAARAWFEVPVGASRSAAVAQAVAAAKAAFAGDTTKRATRVWSQLTLERIVPVLPELIGGSADLTGSNGTRTKQHIAVAAKSFAGNYIHYGVREHGMAAAMNGLALHGLIPYGGTFLTFTDYCRPAIRLSALMRQRVVYVMTHDSIGLGEDGPTHQPIEHLAALRAIPNLLVLRPADGVETAECWEIALGATETPTILALTRQAVPNLRTAEAGEDNRCTRGGYVLKAPAGGRDVTLVATGSEVGLAVEAAALLEAEGMGAAVVSLPSFELFRQQPESYRAEILGEAPRIAIEAGVAQGWHEWLRPGDRFVGLSDFGASAPAADVFRHFGLTAPRIAEEAQRLVSR
jgi:transketolase